MSNIIGGIYSWRGSRDPEGHRSYTITFRVEGTIYDGPASILATPGLPIPGQMWAFGVDFDIWAWCRYETEIEPELEGDPNRFWKITYHFSTKPPEGRARDHDPASTREDPLLEPPKVSGGFDRKSVEITHDRFGRAIKTSSHEQIRGSEVEFDESHPTVTIEFNSLYLNLPLFSKVRDKLNDRPLWGMPKRTIRIADISWERRFHANSFRYYSIKYVFEANTKGWDRTLLDEGTKALDGEWSKSGPRIWVLKTIDGGPPDPKNPGHFKRFKDPEGENTRVILDGAGKPYVPDGATGCAECPDGMAKDWVVQGTHIGPFPLRQVTGCMFQPPLAEFAFSRSYEATLNYVASNWELTITYIHEDTANIPDSTVRYIYQPSGGFVEWQCSDSNRMIKQTATGPDQEGWPDEIYITSGDLAMPGKIKVEHYGEANFFLLGIPAVLG